MRSEAYTHLLGLVAIFAGLAVLAFSSSRLIDNFGGMAVLSGLGATAWACGGRSLLRMYIGALLTATLFAGSLFLVIMMSRSCGTDVPDRRCNSRHRRKIREYRSYRASVC